MKKADKPQVLKVLRRMKTLLRKGWTQNVSARNAKGYATLFTAADATRFCLLGAEYRAAYELESQVPIEAVEPLLRRCAKARNIPDYNDDPKRTKKEILAVVDCAIQKVAQ
jgi:hypothetical protein